MRTLIPAIFLMCLALGCQEVKVTDWNDTGSKALRRSVNAPFEAMIAQAPKYEPVAGSVYFEYDSAALTDDARRDLDGIAERLSQLSGPVVIEGHADHNNTDEFNLRLGYQRALAAADYLRSAGVWEERMVVKSFGETRASASNFSDAGRAQNRAVIIKSFPQGEGMSGDDGVRALEKARNKDKKKSPGTFLLQSVDTEQAGS